MPSDQTLVQRAQQAREYAVADLSGYSVGAALQSESGEVFTGCNVENIVLAETVCAEKVALLKAISQGQTRFEAVAVFTVSSPPATPCGSCRQLLHHWKVARVISSNPAGELATWTVAELLPSAFEVDRSDL